MTDYSLWEVIINGDSVISRVAVDGVAQPVNVLTAEQKLARKNELKACGTLLMALPDKHQLKLNTHKDAKTLIEAIEKLLEETLKLRKLQKLVSQLEIHGVSLSQEDVNLNLRIYKAEVKHSSSPCNPSQNIAFMSSSNTDSTTDSVSAATSVSAVCAQLPVSSHPNIDSLSNAVIFSFFASQSASPQLDNEDLKQIDVDDLEEMDMRWQMAMLTMRTRRFLQKTRRNLEEEPANFALMAISSSSSSNNEENIIVLKNEVEARDNFILTFKQKVKQAEIEKDDLKLKFEKFQSSSKSLTELIAGNLMPPKPDLVFNIAPLAVESDHSDFSVQVSPAKPAQAMSHTTESMDPIIEDWVSDSEDEFEPNNPHNVSVQPIEIPILAATPKPTIQTSSNGKRKNRKTCFVCKSVDHLIKDCNFHVKSQTKPTPKNSAHRGCNKHNSSSKVTAAKVPVVSAVKGKKGKWGNPQHALKDKRVIDSGCSRHMTWNMSYLSDFQELNGGYVSFRGNPKGGKITGKGKIKTDFKLPDENQVLLRVPREINMYNVNLKDIVPSGDLTCLFSKATIDESNLWHRRLEHATHGLGWTNIYQKPKTPQQNGIAEKKNRTLIKAARTMLADSLLPIPFWAEAVNTACYVQNRVLVTKPQNKTPYELLHGRAPSIAFMRPFGYPMTIFNTLESLGKFEGKVDEGFLVGYFVNSKAFRVFNSQTRIVQETLYVNSLENKSNVTGNQSDPSTGFQEKYNAGKTGEEANQQYMLFPVWSTGSTNPQNKEGDATFDAEKPEATVNLSLSSSALSGEQDDITMTKDKGKSPVDYFTGNRDFNKDFEDYSEDSSDDVSAAGLIVPTAGQNYSNNTNPISAVGPSNSNTSLLHRNSSFQDASQSPDIVYSDHENVGAEADFNNLETSIIVSPIPTTRIHHAHPISQIIGNLSSTIQTRSMARINRDQGGISQILNEDFHICMFACFVSQEEPKRVHQSLKDPSWIEAIQEELLQFKMQKDTQEEGIDYEEVFAPVARIEALILFLAYASFMGFMVYQMDVKGAFLYETIEEEVYVCQPPGFQDLDYPNKVYKVVKVKQKEDGIFINQDKYVAEILKKFGLTKGKSASTPIDIEKPLMMDPDGEDVDVHIYRSMIGSLMYLTSSRPDIMFAFWKTVALKQSNDVTRIQALVDKKKVVVTEAIIRDALHLDDAEGVECLPNEEIFSTLALMGHEKPSTKLTFYKAFFSSQVGKGCSGVETPLFEGMIEAREPENQGNVEEQGDEEEQGNGNNATEEHVTIVNAVTDQSTQSRTPLTPLLQQPQEALDAYAALTRRAEHLEQDRVAQDLEIIKLKTRVKKLERANKVKTMKLKRLRKIGTRDVNRDVN
nr:hypothetical protein [Tanacetum cinerariifolium]